MKFRDASAITAADLEVWDQNINLFSSRARVTEDGKN